MTRSWVLPSLVCPLWILLVSVQLGARGTTQTVTILTPAAVNPAGERPGLSLRPRNGHYNAVGVAAESRAGWTMAGISAGIAGFWLAGGGLRDAELNGFTGLVANAYMNIVSGLALPAVGARIFSRYPGHRLARLYRLCGLPSSIKLASFSRAQHGVVDRAQSLPGGFVSSRIWLRGFSPLLTFGVPWFSDGRMPFRRHGAGPHGRADAVASTVQVLGASIHGAPVGRLLADALDGPGTPVSPTTRTTVPAR